MPEPDFLKCACQRCGGHIEFPASGAGATVNCPHCGADTVLTAPGGSPAMAKKSRRVVWISLGLLVLVAGGVTAAFVWRQRQKPPVSSATEAVTSITATTLTNTPPPSETINNFSIGKITLQKVPGSGLVYAVGTAKNTIDRQRFGVTIELNLLNENGENIGSASDYISVVEPHKSWQFKALLTSAGVASVTVADIKEQ